MGQVLTSESESAVLFLPVVRLETYIASLSSDRSKRNPMSCNSSDESETECRSIRQSSRFRNCDCVQETEKTAERLCCDYSVFRQEKKPAASLRSAASRRSLRSRP